MWGVYSYEKHCLYWKKLWRLTPQGKMIFEIRIGASVARKQEWVKQSFSINLGQIKHYLKVIIVIYSSRYQQESWDTRGASTVECTGKKMNKLYLKSSISSLLCTTTRRITFNNEDFCIHVWSANVKAKKCVQRKKCARGLSLIEIWTQGRYTLPV